MTFLFVGSSGLTEAPFPRDLAIPQLLLSSACVILPTMKAGRTTVFPHRGLSPHQFTPMSGAHQTLETNCRPCHSARSTAAIRTRRLRSTLRFRRQSLLSAFVPPDNLDDLTDGFCERPRRGVNSADEASFSTRFKTPPQPRLPRGTTSVAAYRPYLHSVSARLWGFCLTVAALD
jgi:hypothetical protein